MNRKNQKTNKLTIFAACSPGLEEILESELKNMHVANIIKQKGGIQFSGDKNTLIRANLRLRTATRILLRIANFQSTEFYHLESNIEAINWADYFDIKSMPKIEVSTTCKKSKLYHSQAVSTRVEKFIKKSLGLKKESKISSDFEQSVYIRIRKDLCTVSIDASGDLLYMRGYKTKTTKAPMRETLAAAALIFSNYNSAIQLVDPMCGSGTFLSEASLISTKTAPGINREFAFSKWPIIDELSVKKERDMVIKYAADNIPVMAGFDVDKKAVKATIYNLKNLKRDNIEIKVQSIEKLRLPIGPGLLICNPPWGKRMEEGKELSNLYKTIGNIIKESKGWDLCLITTSKRLAMKTKLEFKKVSAPIPLGGKRINIYSTR